MGRPALLTSAELAIALGYADRSAIHRRIDRGDIRLAACRISGNHWRCWSRARLEAGGYLCAEVLPAVVDPQPYHLPAPAHTVAVWRIA
jgi:hypothetical protein